MSTSPQELAKRAVRNVHALCVKGSGTNYFCDIPLNTSISLVRFGEQQANTQGRIATRCVRINPDVARLLNPEYVSDDFYASACEHKNAFTEGEGAERLNAVLRSLCRHTEPGNQRLARFSLNGEGDMLLIRNFLWREGYNWQQVEGDQSPLKIIDVRHALMIIAGISRTMGYEGTLPKELRDFDLDPRNISATKLCGLYGLPTPDEGSESSALLRLVIAAREAEYAPDESTESAQQPGGLPALKALGGTLDHLEGIAGIPANGASTGEARKWALRLLTPAGNDVEITPSDVGLLLHEGAWLPVIPTLPGARQSGTDPYLYSVPDGQPIPGPVNMSAALARLDLLASEHGWDGAADERLQRLCGREGDLLSFQSIREAFQQTSHTWLPPEPHPTMAPKARSNGWTRISDCRIAADQFATAEKVAHAINRGKIQDAQKALAEISEQVSRIGDGSPEGLQILLNNLRLTASRADLMNDGREAWLRQMALLADPESWPGQSPLEAETLPVILFGDGPVANHNRVAIASRSALGISVSNAARAAVSAPPSSLMAGQMAK